MASPRFPELADDTIVTDRTLVMTQLSLVPDAVPDASQTGKRLRCGDVGSDEPAETTSPASPAAAQRFGGAFVKAYRIVGFMLLAAILGGLVTYVGSHLFFLGNRSWVAPIILTPSDPKVLGFASQVVAESARRDALLVQRADLETRRREAERMMGIEKTFQSAYTSRDAC